MTDQPTTKEQTLKPTLGEDVTELFSRIAKLNDQMAAVLAPGWGARMGIIPEGHPLHPGAGQPEPAAWTPPPPGDRREQLPDHLLALLDIPPYTSTACETAELLAAAITRHPARADELRQWEQRQRQRCRINNKYTGVNCRHTEPEPALTPDDSDPADLTGYLAPDSPIGCLTVTAERTPSQLPGLRDQLADATVPLLLDTLPKVIARARGYEVADVVLTLLYREWPWLRAVAEDAAPPACP